MTLTTRRVCRGPFISFVTDPYSMVVYGLPWTPAITWEPEQALMGWKGPEVPVSGIMGKIWTN